MFVEGGLATHPCRRWLTDISLSGPGTYSELAGGSSTHTHGSMRRCPEPALLLLAASPTHKKYRAYTQREREFLATYRTPNFGTHVLSNRALALGTICRLRHVVGVHYAARHVDRRRCCRVCEAVSAYAYACGPILWWSSFDRVRLCVCACVCILCTTK